MPKKNIRTIYLNMRFLTQRITGVQRFAFALCQELDKLALNNPQLKLVGLAPKREVNHQYSGYTFKSIYLQHCGYFSGHLWEQLELPWHSRNGLLLNWCNTAPIFKFQQWITLHDIIFMTQLDSQKWWFKLWYRCIASIGTRTAGKIFTVSHFSAREIIRVFPHAVNKITVLGNAPSIADFTYNDQVLARWALKPKRFFLMIGSNSKRKNTGMVAKLFAESAQLQHSTLVIVGGQFSNLGANQEIVSPNIIYTNYISDGELRSLYHHAQALIFPSLYEGFGIPVIEAMGEGTLVLAADIEVLHEVCGDVALYFDPSDSKHLLHVINYVSHKQMNVRCIINNASLRLHNFNWQKYALKIYSQFCEEVVS